MATFFLGSLMVFGVILGRLVLKEKLNIGAVLSLLICFIGFSVLIAGPYLTIMSKDNKDILSLESNETLSNVTEKRNTIFQGNLPQNNRNIQTTNLSQLILGIVFAVVAGFGEAVSVVSLNIIQDNLPSIHVLTFWFLLSGIICSAAGMFVFERDTMTFPTEILSSCYLAGHVLTSSGALLCYIIAMETLSASLMSILASAQIPINVLIQYAFFKQLQPINGGILEIIGASIATMGLIIQPFVAIIGENSITTNQSDNEKHILLTETKPKNVSKLVDSTEQK